MSAQINNSVILAGLAIGLSACMSSIAPTILAEDTTPVDNLAQLSMAYDNPLNGSPVNSSPVNGLPVNGDQPNQSATERTNNSANLAGNTPPPESGKQLLADLGDGNMVAIPVRNPIAIASVSGSLQYPPTDLTSQNSNLTQLAYLQTQSSNASITPRPVIEPGKQAAPVSQGQQPSIAANPSALNNSEARIKPGFLARLFQRSRKNFYGNKNPTDDRKSSILLSSRTASMSNRGSLDTGNLANIPGGNSTATGSLAGQGSSIQIASAAGMARQLLPKLKTQHSGVDIDCILPGVMRLVGVVERRYGKVPVVTSGYRSPSRNRRAGGARNSMHIYCKAVDIQVEGVSKWDLAKFLRTVPGRGGVGTYCNTNSVHIDTGPKRDWHYSCRRKSKLRRKA